MTEHTRLQRIRDLGIRLQELQLIQVPVGASYASAALGFVFRLYHLPKPVGLRLEDALSALGHAIINQHKLPYSQLNADSVLLFLTKRFAATSTLRQHPSYRGKERTYATPLYN